jgi:hypothetical protein
MGRNYEFVRGFNNPEVIDNLGDVDVDGRIILMRILMKYCKVRRCELEISSILDRPNGEHL